MQAHNEVIEASNGAGYGASPGQLVVLDDVRVGKLDSLARVREETAKLYRAARRKAGRYPSPADAARLNYLLQAIGQSLLMREFGDRIAAIEQRMGVH